MMRVQKSLPAILPISLLLMIATGALAWSAMRPQSLHQRILCRTNFPLGDFRSGSSSSDYRQAMPAFSETEMVQIDAILAKWNESPTESDHEAMILHTLPTLSPSLLLKLRQCDTHDNESVQSVANSVNQIIHQRLELAREMLTSLLQAGEIRKLDSLIGQAARDNRLDVAFFNVLTKNLEDAKQHEDNIVICTDNKDGTAAASRLQILQHIYTRCQEEVEKELPHGTALLNKLLRTEHATIRANLYKHFLTPAQASITSPDGKTIVLNQQTPVVRVPLSEFIDALSTAVIQIRSLESAGGTDRESAAMMVEGCRHIAKEARVVIGEVYGRQSAQLKQFEEGLQPVFRPASPDSPYIQGEKN